MICPNFTKIVEASLDACFVLDAKSGNVLHINAAGQRLFDCSTSPSGGKESYLSFFSFSDRELSHVNGTIMSWSEIVEPLVAASADTADTSSSPSTIAERFDVTAYLRKGSEFDASVSLTYLDGCHCCKDVSSIVCVYLREASSKQQRYVTSLEREIRRLQSSECALDASFDAFFSINTKGTVLSVNRAAVEVFGYDSRKELIGRDISCVVGKEHADAHKNYIKRYLKTKEKRVMGKQRSLPARRKDGTEFTIQLGLIEIRSAFKNETIFCGFIKDLSAEEEHKKGHQLKERLMTGLIEASQDPMFMITQDGIIKMVNSAATTVFQYEKSEFLEQNISMITGEHAKNHDKYIQNYLKSGVKKAMGQKRELKATKKNGDEFYIELGLSEVFLDNGDRMFCGFVRDLTNQKIAEEKQKALVESSPEAMLEINEKGTILLANSAATKIFGWTHEELIGSNVNLIVGGEHAKEHSKYLARYLTTGEKRVMGKSRELPARKKDGTEFPIELGLTEVVLKDGHRVFCGFIRDLTSEKAAKERMKRKEQLTQAMINSSFDAIFQINERGIIQMANQAAIDHFGWTKEEFLGNNISMIAAGEHGRNHNKYLERYLRTGEKHAMGKRRKVNAKRKDGSTFPIELGLTEVETIWGERFFCGFVRDVRRERYDEQELQEQTTLTKAILDQSGLSLLTCDEYGQILTMNESLLQLLGLQKEDTREMDLRDIMGTEYTNRYIGDNLAKYVRSVSGKRVEVEGLKACGTLIPLQMRLKEVEGSFDIMLGAHKTPDGPTGTRLFAAFFEEKVEQQHTGVNKTLFGFLGGLQKEEEQPAMQ